MFPTERLAEDPAANSEDVATTNYTFVTKIGPYFNRHAFIGTDGTTATIQ